MSAARRVRSVAVCGAAIAVALSASGHARAETGGMAAALKKKAGGVPVLLAVVDHNVEARSADGKLKTVITPGPLDDAVYDAGLEMLWVRRSGQLEVWDLRQDKPKAIPILADAANQGDFVVERGDHRVTPLGMCDVPGTMSIKWSQRPSVEVVGFDEASPPVHPRLVGAAWLTKEFGRALRPVPADRAMLPSVDDKSRVSISAKVGKCENPPDCGSGAAFGKTGWTLVVANQPAGADCQHFQCVLHDPKAKAFGKPPLPAKWKPDAQKSMLGECGLYRFEPEGKWFAVNNQVCAVGGTCSTLGELAGVIGWLDGERDVGTDY